MEIKNFAQLKRAVQEHKTFVILEHYVHPEFAGQIRIPTFVQTNAFYSAIANDPEHPISKANDGKGYRMEFGKASYWKFEGGVCSYIAHDYKNRIRPIWKISFQE